METIKKGLTIILVCFIVICPLVIYTDISYVNSNDYTYLVDLEHDQQKTVMVAAIKAFLNANNKLSVFSYNDQKAIVTWSYNTFNFISKKAGLGSLEDYYSDIAVANQNGVFKFFYTASGIRLMDDLESAILEYYGIYTTPQEEQIFSGEYFVDADGNPCYVYIYGTKLGGNLNDVYSAVGTPYLLDGNITRESYFGNATFDITTILHVKSSNIDTTLRAFGYSTTEAKFNINNMSTDFTLYKNEISSIT